MKNLIVLLLILTLSACTSNSSVFTEFMDKDTACDYVNVGMVKSVLSIKQSISKEADFSDSFINGYIGAECELTWGDFDYDTDEDTRDSIVFNLTRLKPNEVFPPKKLNEEQLLKKIAQANKSIEASLSDLGQALIDDMQKSTADGIRSHNDYQILDELGDSAIITKLVINNDDDAYMQSMAGGSAEKQGDIIVYTLSVKSGDIIFKATLSNKEQLIQLVTQTLKGK